jgi:hypothetical protein
MLFNLIMPYTLFSILVAKPCVASSSYMTKIRGEKDKRPPLDRWSLVQPEAGEEATGCRWQFLKPCVYHPLTYRKMRFTTPRYISRF